MKLFLKTVFANNAAEDQKFYMTCLRKPNKVKVRPFLQRATKLNGYVSWLPGLVDSRDATERSKKVVPHDDGEFATNMLHAMPKLWKQQYHLGHKAPTSVEYLQEALEKIEVAFPLGDSGGNKNNTNPSKNKMTSLSDKIPKSKSRGVKFERGATKTPKFCSNCKKFGGAHTTHDTKDCNKWDKVGNLKSNFKGTVRRSERSETPPGVNLSYAQLHAENSKLKKSLSKAKKGQKKSSKKKKRKHEYSDSSDDSDSS